MTVIRITTLLTIIISISGTTTLRLKHAIHVAHGSAHKLDYSSLHSFQLDSITTTAESFVIQSNLSPSLTNYVPDPTDKQTVLALAQMSWNGYYEPDKRDKWVAIPGWKDSTQFGWQRDGVRGYIFVDDPGNLMVITLKGTSAKWIGNGETSPRDKFNDNMMFSCCCARVDYTWHPVCGCAKSSNTCSTSCLVQNSNFPDSYYNLAQTIFVAVRSLYPHTAIWLTGHSLGGSLASLLALTNGVPAFAYEAPGDLMFAERLGLLPDLPPQSSPNYPQMRKAYEKFLGSLPIYHFGNTGDPIYLGICNGIKSTCYWGGYALESKCHVGHVCTYKTDASVDIRHHALKAIIDIITDTPGVAECIVPENCTDCDGWTFESDDFDRISLQR